MSGWKKLELAGYETHAADFAERASWFETKTPAYTFRTVIAEFGDLYLCTVARNSFDRQLAADIIAFSRARLKSSIAAKAVSILPGFHSNGYSFDSVVVLGPKANDLFKGFKEPLHGKCLELIPAFAGEFSGRETPEVVQLLRRKIVPTLDWKRGPSPQAWIRFDHPSTGVRSTGKKRAVTTGVEALSQINQLVSGTAGFVEVENALGQTVVVKRLDASEYQMRAAGFERIVTTDDVESWFSSFLTRGIESVSSREASGAGDTSPATLQMFLSDYPRERHIESQQPISVNVSKALDEFDRLSDVEGCFIGFKRKDGRTLQYIWNSDRTVTVDVPQTGERGSLQARGEAERLRGLITRFDAGDPVEALPGLRLHLH